MTKAEFIPTLPSVFLKSVTASKNGFVVEKHKVIFRVCFEQAMSAETMLLLI